MKRKNSNLRLSAPKALEDTKLETFFLILSLIDFCV
jgi:hypothetical protein